MTVKPIDYAYLLIQDIIKLLLEAEASFAAYGPNGKEPHHSRKIETIYVNEIACKEKIPEVQRRIASVPEEICYIVFSLKLIYNLRSNVDGLAHHS